jgi:hypothetical protein
VFQGQYPSSITQNSKEKLHLRFLYFLFCSYLFLFKFVSNKLSNDNYNYKEYNNNYPPSPPTTVYYKDENVETKPSGSLKNKSVRSANFDFNSAFIHNHNSAFTPTTSNKIKKKSEQIFIVRKKKKKEKKIKKQKIVRLF